MGLANPTQRFQDWFTQQWVIMRGRKIDPEDVPWLIGPFGSIGGIGAAFIDQLAENECLIVERNGGSAGLIPSIGNLNLSDFELSKLSRPVIEFYENTADYDLDISVKWNPFFRILGALANKLFSNRIGQLNIPTQNLNDTESLKSEIITLVDPKTNHANIRSGLERLNQAARLFIRACTARVNCPRGRLASKQYFLCQTAMQLFS